MPRFLHIACGEMNKSNTTKFFAQDTWEEVRMDDNTGLQHQPDVCAAMTDMSQLTTGSFDAAFTSHSLERLYPHQVSPVLAEIVRVLNDTGYLLVTCADLQTTCALIAEDKLLETAYDSPAGKVAPLDILYGFRPALAAGHMQFSRHCGFTPKALVGTLAQSGFASVWTARNPETFTIAAIATKKEHSEEQLRTLAQQHFS